MTNLPITGSFRITAIYGQINKSYWKTYHKGVDIVCDNKSIYATCDGKVTKIAYDDDGWGRYVVIKDGANRNHIFCHLVIDSVRVNVGQTVDRSTVIGTMGATGNVTGVHLHYQINNANNKDINPCDYLGIPNKKGTYDSNNYHINQKEDKIMTYKDDEKISKWAKDAVYEAQKDGYMLGDDLGNFNPQNPVTREELAVVLKRLK